MLSRRLLVAATLTVVASACSQPADPESQDTTTEVPSTAPAAPKTPEPPAATAGATEQAALSHIDASFEQLIHEVATYSEAERDRALAAIRTELREVDARIDALALRADFEAGQLSEEAQAKREAAVAALKEHRAAVATWTESMKNDSSSAWGELRKGFAQAYEELGQAFANAEKSFAD